MKKILELEFNKDVTLDEIYEELNHYKTQGIMATCKYKNFVLSNENDDNLNFLISRLKLNMSESEYDEYLERQKKKKTDYSILFTMMSAPLLLKYYVERGTLFIAESSKKEEYALECYYWYGNNNEHIKSIKIATKLLEALYAVNLNDINLGNQIISTMMDDLSIDDDQYINTAEMIINKVVNEDFTKIEKLLFVHNAEERQATYEKKLKVTYSKNKGK